MCKLLTCYLFFILILFAADFGLAPDETADARPDPFFGEYDIAPSSETVRSATVH